MPENDPKCEGLEETSENGAGFVWLGIVEPELHAHPFEPVLGVPVPVTMPVTVMRCQIARQATSSAAGRLAARAHPARVLTLIISDVPGDDPAVIGSGPTVADPTTSEEARSIIRKYHLDVPRHVLDFLESPQSETPKPGDPRLARAEAKVIAAASQSLAAAAHAAHAAGLSVINLGDRIEGEARVLLDEVTTHSARRCTGDAATEIGPSPTPK